MDSDNFDRDYNFPDTEVISSSTETIGGIGGRTTDSSSIEIV